VLDVASRDLDAPVLVRVATLLSLFPFTLYASNIPEGENGVQMTWQEMEFSLSDAVEGTRGDRRLAQLSFERALFDCLRILLDGGYLGLSFSHSHLR
jgi:hypothetical protein